MELDNRYANILSTAYYELFNTRLALIRLGVGTKLSLYEFVAVNLSLIPVMIIILSIVASMGWYFHERSSLVALENTNKEYSSYFQEEKGLKQEIARQEKNIATAQQKIDTIDKTLKSKIEVQDTMILYEIAQKLPNDMILTSIEKKVKNIGKKKKKNAETTEVIEVKGRCYLERSLLNYIKNLKFKDRQVYVVGMEDSKETRFESNEEANFRYITEYLKQYQQQQNDTNSSQVEPVNFLGNMGTKVKYSDTLNNSFTLEESACRSNAFS